MVVINPTSEKGEVTKAEFEAFKKQVLGPEPSGSAATDVANIEATLKKAGEVGGVAVFNQPGTYLVSKEQIVPSNASFYIGPDTVFQAVAGFEGEALLSSSKTEIMSTKMIYGGGILDANNQANVALYPRYFNHLVLGVKPRNALQNDCILGDPTATGQSSEPIVMPGEYLTQRTAGTVPTGGYCLWARNATDGRIYGTVATGQETGIRIDKGGWKGFGVHPVGAAYPMQVGIEDNAGAEWYGSNFDTPTPKEHAGATGEAATQVILDPAILAQHIGRPVSGVNIPAEAFVGEVTPGVSFKLVAANGGVLKPSGAVAGITLAGVGLYSSSSSGLLRVQGGQVYVNPTFGVDNSVYGVVIGSKATVGTVSSFAANGGSGAFRVAKAITGKLTPISWWEILESNCVTKMAPENKFLGTLSATFELGAESVEESKLKALAVSTAKLAEGAVTAAKLAAEAVGTAALAALSVTTAKIAEGAVTAAKLGAEAVGAAALAAGAVTAAKLGAEAVETAAIKARNVTKSKLTTEVENALVIPETPGAITERAEGAEFEPSATKPTQVLLQLSGATLTRTVIAIVNNGVTVSEPAISVANTGVTTYSVSFIVAAGKKWKWTKVEGTPTVKTSYTVL